MAVIPRGTQGREKCGEREETALPLFWGHRVTVTALVSALFPTSHIGGPQDIYIAGSYIFFGFSTFGLHNVYFFKFFKN